MQFIQLFSNSKSNVIRISDEFDELVNLIDISFEKTT